MERKRWMIGLRWLWRRVCGERRACSICSIDSQFLFFVFFLFHSRLWYLIWSVKFFKVFGCSDGFESGHFIRVEYYDDNKIITTNVVALWFRRSIDECSSARRYVIGSINSSPIMLENRMPFEWAYDFDFQLVCLRVCVYFTFVFVVIRCRFLFDSIILWNYSWP